MPGSCCSTTRPDQSRLEGLGIINEPLPLLYNEFAIVLGLVYNYVPFVILALYSSISRLDRSCAKRPSILAAPPGPRSGASRCR
jgi:ABC-type spermidine/putrescine transport system permease subunit I